MNETIQAPRPKRCHPILPIFRLAMGDNSILYAPGQLTLVPAEVSLAIEANWLRGKKHPDGPVGRLASALVDAAHTAVDTWRQRIEASFRPVCLTLYLSNRCNLACRYCYSATSERGPDSPIIDEAAVHQAAIMVADHCRARGESFRFVVHGGGEPSLHPAVIERLVTLTRKAADQTGVGWFGYIATNGVMSQRLARRLADLFDVVGLSCDGPPDMHDRQRPTGNGKSTSRQVEATAAAVHAAEGRLAVRATVTPRSVGRQVDVVEYAHTQLRAAELRLEPVYGVNGRVGEGFSPDDAPVFLRHYRAAEERANRLGMRVGISGTRPDELHGPHCNVLKDVLQMIPDGTIVGCFLCNSHDQARSLAIGHWQADSEQLVLDLAGIARARRAAGVIPKKCRDCINAYHCARECPDACYVSEPLPSVPSATGMEVFDGFRCRVQRSLTEHWLMQAVANGVPAVAGGYTPPETDYRDSHRGE